jgi:conjugal transfer pilus assembly protein TraE
VGDLNTVSEPVFRTPNIKKVTVNGKVLEKEFTENTDMNKQLNEAEAQ